ncbi:MAG: hypothetical protein KME64_15760 [Scytonematopsis contorta HA4267-MV1]|nr:hypothetical protein [Scytonematopsis contorta HA4267-MV1]
MRNETQHFPWFVGFPKASTQPTKILNRAIYEVEERNPTFSVVCWVSQSLNPTYKILNRAIYEAKIKKEE